MSINEEIKDSKKHESDFDVWWFNEGSGIRPIEKEDAEEHCRRVSRIAWLNGAFNARSK